MIERGYDSYSDFNIDQHTQHKLSPLSRQHSDGEYNLGFSTHMHTTMNESARPLFLSDTPYSDECYLSIRPLPQVDIA